jgi:hypothetical protein
MAYGYFESHTHIKAEGAAPQLIAETVVILVVGCSHVVHLRQLIAESSYSIASKCNETSYWDTPTKTWLQTKNALVWYVYHMDIQHVVLDHVMKHTLGTNVGH